MKKITKNDYFKKIYNVILYIEKNYKNDIHLDEISKIAIISKYHFSRIFKYMVGESIEKYIKRVKVSSSTKKFLYEKNITKIAVGSGYNSLQSFSKAFKEIFEINPKEFSKSILNNNNIIMKPIKNIEIKPFNVLYVRKEGKYSEAAGKAFEILMKFAYTQKIKYKKNILGKDSFTYGIGHDNPKITKENNIRYDACLTFNDDSIELEGEVGKKKIDGGKYLVFLHKGDYEGLEKTYSLISNYIVNNNIKLRDVPMFDKYLNRDPRKTKTENLKTEIYIPIK